MAAIILTAAVLIRGNYFCNLNLRIKRIKRLNFLTDSLLALSANQVHYQDIFQG